MKRRLFNLGAGFSLLACSFVGVVWVMSWSQTYARPKVFDGPGLQLQARTGRFFAVRLTCSRPTERTSVEVSSPFVPGQPGTLGSHWYAPGIDEETQRLQRGYVYGHGLSQSGPRMPANSLSNAYGFGYSTMAIGNGIDGWCASFTSIPMWFALLVTSLLPVAWLAAMYHRWVRRHRQTNGLCVICGYDLRATPERCPECGTPKPVQMESQR